MHSRCPYKNELAQCTIPKVWTRHYAYIIIVSNNTISPIIAKYVADLSQRRNGTLGGHDVGQVMQRVQTANNVVPYTVTMQCQMKYGNMKLHIQRSAGNWPALRPQSGCSDVCMAQREFLHTEENVKLECIPTRIMNRRV